jgi:hypothetical protein
MVTALAATKTDLANISDERKRAGTSKGFDKPLGFDGEDMVDSRPRRNCSSRLQTWSSNRSTAAGRLMGTEQLAWLVAEFTFPPTRSEKVWKRGVALTCTLC